MKPGSVPGPVRVRPNKKSDLTAYRRAKRVQDYLNSQAAKLPGPAAVLLELATQGYVHRSLRRE